MYSTPGIHHVTAITADPQRNLDFYEGFLGQRLVKKTVNFDDPNAYHLYYGDAVGTPGTIMTFFYWQGIPAGQKGAGEVHSIYYAIPTGSLSYWQERAAEYDVTVEAKTLPFGEAVLMLEDPDGLIIGLVETDETITVSHWTDGPVPEEYGLKGFYGALLALPEYTPMDPLLTNGLGYEQVETKDGITRYTATAWPGKFLATQELPVAEKARQGAGSIHHIAFQAGTDDDREALQHQVQELGLGTTGFIDRQYFHSTYFMTPGMILFEIATNDIGFTVDEPAEELGSNLKLPPQYEGAREAIEPALTPLNLPRLQ